MSNDEKNIKELVALWSSFETYRDHGTREEQRREYPLLMLRLDDIKNNYFEDVKNTYANKIRSFFGFKVKLQNSEYNTFLGGFMMQLLEQIERVGIDK